MSAHLHIPFLLPKHLENFLKLNVVESERFIQEVFKRIEWCQSHTYGLTGSACVDGRVSDLSFILGLLQGIMLIDRSPGLKHSTLSFRPYARRVMRMHEDIVHRTIGAYQASMKEMRFVTAHWSSGHPHHGCAAWKSNKDNAVTCMHRLADEFEAWSATLKPNELIVVRCLIDTDDDSIRIFASKNGASFSTKEIARSPTTQDDIKKIVLHELQNIAHPFCTLKDEGKALEELAEHLTANVSFVRNVFARGRPTELLTHQERLILIGSPLETTDHNAAFLIQDSDLSTTWRELEIGLPIVGKNTIIDAVRDKNPNWMIPICISLPYRGEQDRYPTERMCLGIKRDIEERLAGYGKMLMRHFSEQTWWKKIPSPYQRALVRGPMSRVFVYPTMNNVATRHLEYVGG